MSNELSVNAPQVPMTAGKYATPAVASGIATGRKFLPQIRVMGSNTNVVKEGKYTGIGTFAFVTDAGQKFENAGDTLVALILSWRPRALCYGPYANSFNPESDVFKNIAAGAAKGGQNNKNSVGPEFLLWVFDHGLFAEFYHGSISLSMEGDIGIGIFNKQVEAKAWKPVQFKIELARKKAQNQVWHTSRITEYEGVVAPEKFPNFEEMTQIKERFDNPKEAVVENAETDVAGSGDSESRVR